MIKTTSGKPLNVDTSKYFPTLEAKSRYSPICLVCGEKKSSGEHAQIVCWGDCWRGENGLKYTTLDTEEWLKIFITIK